jgi:hypothetical protein
MYMYLLYLGTNNHHLPQVFVQLHPLNQLITAIASIVSSIPSHHGGQIPLGRGP